MQILSEGECLRRIRSEKKFEAVIEGGAFVVRIREYVPYLCTAIHAGHRLRDQLASNCLIQASDRLIEEDPWTDNLIDSFPVALVVNDSRYEYDLNRDRQNCVYQSAWGKEVWNEPLTDLEKECSRKKHDQYYRVLGALLTVLEKKFGGCFFVDVHSYNWQVRSYDRAPIFNMGTSQIDVERFKKTFSTFEKKLLSIELPNLEVDVQRNVVFQGKGYQVTFVKNTAPNTLIIPLEIKKIFMDEASGEPFPLVLERLQGGLFQAVLAAATVFNKTLSRSSLKRSDLLVSNIEPVVIAIDKTLYRLCKSIETLHYVNPVNLQQEKRKFLSQKDYVPQFRYRQLRIDPYDFCEQLHKLPVSEILDPEVRALYRSVIDAYSIKIAMLAGVGTPQFLYNSLRYYGEPSPADIANARFILHANQLQVDLDERTVTPEEAKVFFEQAVKDMDLPCSVMLTGRILAKAMVNNSRRTLLVNRNVSLSRLEINALIHHELGVHMVTTINALEQPLFIFRLGLPGNTYTQEGLAILSEYLSGNINLHRLRQLSLRVLAVDMMVRGMPFNDVYAQLSASYQIPPDEAFSLVVRVFRGGGLTKDYLYLSGFRDLLALHQTSDLSQLLVGKTGLQFRDTIVSLIERGILKKPTRLMPALQMNAGEHNPVLDYLVSSIK